MRYNRLTTCNSISVGLRSTMPKEPAFAPKATPTKGKSTEYSTTRTSLRSPGTHHRQPEASLAVGHWKLAERDLLAAGMGGRHRHPQKRGKADGQLAGQRFVRQPHQLAGHSLQLAGDPELGLGPTGFPTCFHMREAKRKS